MGHRILDPATFDTSKSSKIWRWSKFSVHFRQKLAISPHFFSFPGVLDRNVVFRRPGCHRCSSSSLAASTSVPWRKPCRTSGRRSCRTAASDPWSRPWTTTPRTKKGGPLVAQFWPVPTWHFPTAQGYAQDPMVHRYALSALSPLAYIPENGAQIIDAGGVSAVKNTLQYHSGDPQVAISALSILWDLNVFMFWNGFVQK